MKVLIERNEEWLFDFWITADKESMDLWEDEPTRFIDIPDELYERCQQLEKDFDTLANELRDYISSRT